MEHEIRGADDYLQHVAGALDEATREIDSAATVFVESEEAKRQLGETLGQARNALTRARRDLDAHVARELRRDDRSAAETYFENLALVEDQLAQIVVAIMPLPLEEERISVDMFAQRTFQNDFTNWVTRFNNDERRNTPATYLLEVPGGTTPRLEQDHFRFEAIPQGGAESSQTAWLYPSGAFVFKSRLYSWTDPPSYTIGLVIEEVRATIKFVWRLYEELRIVPRSVAIQCAITKVDQFHLKTPARFAGFVDWVPNDGVTNIAAPLEPIVLPFASDDVAIKRVVPSVESAVQARYSPSQTSN